jgi:hypothetical protein
VVLRFEINLVDIFFAQNFEEKKIGQSSSNFVFLNLQVEVVSAALFIFYRLFECNQ